MSSYIRIDEAHGGLLEEKERDANEILISLLGQGYTHVAYDPSEGIVGAFDHEVIPDAAFTDFIRIQIEGELNPDAISFVNEFLVHSD